MSYNISEDLKSTFHLATLRNEAAKDLNASEWKKFQQIKTRHDDLRRFEQRAHEMEYKTRVEVARKRIINKAGAKNKDFKHRWFGNDQFDKSATNRQAHRNVRGQHHQLMAGIDKMEARDITKLLDTCEKRNQLRDKPKHDFEQATDRRGRDGLPQDRRQPRPRNRDR